MKDFLESVAEDLYGRYGEDISSFRVLLPNNRSGLFFMDALSHVIARPMWQPRYTSIDEIMSSVAGMEHADRIRAAVELYKAYSKFHSESFDSFYFWGEMLLADFDAIDKYLIDADMLFANVTDLKTLEADISYLTTEQRAVIKRFWDAFETGEMSQQKERFISIWNTLGDVYHDFRLRLFDLDAGYTGMVQRLAAEKIKAGTAVCEPDVHYVVVGFNALTECEKVLFDHLQRNYPVDFYWDYDEYYLADERQEASLFIREDLRRYPMPEGFVLESCFSRPKELVAVSAASDSLQCKYVGRFLDEVVAAQGTVDKRTAIVLTDENLLMPLLYSLPDYVGKVNVTMGYPLKQSLAYGFVERLLMLRHRSRVGKDGEPMFYHADVLGILRHAYVARIDGQAAEQLVSDCIARGQIYIRSSRLKDGGIADRIFAVPDTWHDYADYVLDILSQMEAVVDKNVSVESRLQQMEYLEAIFETLTKLSNSLKECDIDIDIRTFATLARKALQNETLPYSGEPLVGVQVMGILETRNLDFDNVVILSMNDDTFPSSRFGSSSFIPYNLRFAYGMPTPRDSEGVSAYYFYRLLQRARKVHMVYCSKSDENSSGEQSRYIYQLDYESPHKLLRREIGIDVNLLPEKPITVAKTGTVAQTLDKFLASGGREFSPSSFNSYMVCPMKFYFHSVAGIKIEDEISEDVDLPMFGTILHRTMELLYKPLVCADQPWAQIENLIGSQRVGQAVEQAVMEAYFHGEKVERDEWGGNLIMVAETVIRYVNKSILPYDASKHDFKVVGLEEKLSCAFDFALKDGKMQSVVFSGKSDRMDLLDDGTVRIIDYKTGSIHCDFLGVSELLSGSTEAKNGAVLQTFLYSMMVDRMQSAGRVQGHGVCPSLYYVRGMNDKQYSPLLNDKSTGLQVHSYGEYKDELESELALRLKKLFDYDEPFVQTADTKMCMYCDYALICRRR